MTTIWIDAHLSPTIAIWITSTFEITAFALQSGEQLVKISGN